MTTNRNDWPLPAETAGGKAGENHPHEVLPYSRFYAAEDYHKNTTAGHRQILRQFQQHYPQAADLMNSTAAAGSTDTWAATERPRLSRPTSTGWVFRRPRGRNSGKGQGIRNSRFKLVQGS